MSRDRNLVLREIVRSHFYSLTDHTFTLNEIKKMWQAGADMASRNTLPAHCTASAVLLHASQVLVIEHKNLNRWLFPGGHIDAGELPDEAARRELYEETGMSGTLISSSPVEIDFHPIPANSKRGEPAHFHIDFRYLFSLNAAQAGYPDWEEIVSMKWVSPHDVPISPLLRKSCLFD